MSERFFICNECGEFFTEEEKATRKEYHAEISEEGCFPFEEFDACPVCGSDDIDPAESCHICGSPLRKHECDLCDECIRALHGAIRDCVVSRMGEDIESQDALDAADDYLETYYWNK